MLHSERPFLIPYQYEDHNDQDEPHQMENGSVERRSKL